MTTRDEVLGILADMRGTELKWLNEAADTIENYIQEAA